jgi:predicted membrane chloride channel (bestrophin family)
MEPLPEVTRKWTAQEVPESIHSFHTGYHWVSAVRPFKSGRIQANKQVLAAVYLYTLGLVLLDEFRDRIPADSPLGVVLWDRNSELKGLSSSATSGISFVMALLLAFRLREAYSRWYEARMKWGQLISICSDICRATSVYMASSAPRGLQEPTCQFIFDCASAFPILLKNFLRASNRDNAADLKQLGLGAPTIKILLEPGSGPGTRPWQWCLTMISASIDDATKAKYVNELQAKSIEESVIRATGVGGVCSRILSTPLNYAVSLHIRSTLALHFIALPLICVGKQLGTAWTIAVVSMNLFVIISLDQIAHHLEAPFSLEETGLPLEIFCNLIAKNTEFYTKMDTRKFLIRGKLLYGAPAEAASASVLVGTLPAATDEELPQLSVLTTGSKLQV